MELRRRRLVEAQAGWIVRPIDAFSFLEWTLDCRNVKQVVRVIRYQQALSKLP